MDKVGTIPFSLPTYLLTTQKIKEPMIEKTVRATEREFEIIGESVKKLPHSLTHEYPEIPWRAIAGMRDRLIQGPLLVNHPYRLEREVVALSESRRVESQWTLTRVYDEKSGTLTKKSTFNLRY